jgi:hypothetical protein
VIPTIRATYLSAAQSATSLLADPAVGEQWDRPSVLDGMTVGALAGHLARGVLQVEWYLDDEVPGPPSIDAEQYYADLAELSHQNVMYEMGTRPAFHALLMAAGREHGWTLIAEHGKKVNGKTIRPDGTFKDAMNLVRGHWEAKDTSDKLDVEIEKKRNAGYPFDNILFEDTATAVLFQNGQRVMSSSMKHAEELTSVIVQFFRYTKPAIQEFVQVDAQLGLALSRSFRVALIGRNLLYPRRVEFPASTSVYRAIERQARARLLWTF